MLMKQPKATGTTTRSILEDRTITPFVVLMVLLVSSLFFTGTALAASPSTTSPQIPLTGYCSHPNGNGHCYAVREWLGHTGGTNTLINPTGALSCYGCAGFIDDEMWFSDTSSSQCTAVGTCWVEAGISTWPANLPQNCHQGFDSTCGSWADNRPNPGGYNQHALYNFGADGVDLSPYLFYVTISNNTCCSSSGSIWNVSTNIYKNGSWIAGPTGQSTKNSMNANDIMIGSELSDSGGSADVFFFQYNEWMNGGGGWDYQTTTGSSGYSTDAPPSGLWAINPCNCSGNTGGTFETYD